jgi:hypothetical protein
MSQKSDQPRYGSKRPARRNLTMRITVLTQLAKGLRVDVTTAAVPQGWKWNGPLH